MIGLLIFLFLLPFMIFGVILLFIVAVKFWRYMLALLALAVLTIILIFTPIDFVFKVVIFYFAGAILWVIASNKDNG